MGFMDKAKSFAKDQLKKSSSIGTVSSYDFPVGTYINLKVDNNEPIMLFTLPNKTEYEVTHDKVKHAEVLAMGVIEIKQQGNTTISLYGTKYRVDLVDGKTAILTVGLGATLEQIEHIIF